MENEQMAPEVSPRVRSRTFDLLRENFAAVSGRAPESVEPGSLVSDFLSDDPTQRHRFVSQLERAFSIPIDGARFDAARTVGELADLIALKVQTRKAAGRSYVVCYRDASGRLAEAHVRARNHNEAVDALRAQGLVEVVGIERDEDDGDSDMRAGRVHNAWSGCVLPLLAAFAVAAGAVAFYWWRKG